jgi:hypothetical protein
MCRQARSFDFQPLKKIITELNEIKKTMSNISHHSNPRVGQDIIACWAEVEEIAEIPAPRAEESS